MKSLITTGLIALGIAGSSLFMATNAQAERMRREPPSVEQRVEHLSEKLSLNDSQRDSVSQIMQQHDAQMRSLHEQHGVPDRAAFHDDMRSLHESTREALSEVLDESQLAQLDEMAQQRRRGGPGGKRGGVQE